MNQDAALVPLLLSKGTDHLTGVWIMPDKVTVLLCSFRPEVNPYEELLERLEWLRTDWKRAETKPPTGFERLNADTDVLRLLVARRTQLLREQFSDTRASSQDLLRRYQEQKQLANTVSGVFWWPGTQPAWTLSQTSHPMRAQPVELLRFWVAVTLHVGPPGADTRPVAQWPLAIRKPLLSQLTGKLTGREAEALYMRSKAQFPAPVRRALVQLMQELLDGDERVPDAVLGEDWDAVRTWLETRRRMLPAFPNPGLDTSRADSIQFAVASYGLNTWREHDEWRTFAGHLHWPTFCNRLGTVPSEKACVSPEAIASTEPWGFPRDVLYRVLTRWKRQLTWRERLTAPPESEDKETDDPVYRFVTVAYELKLLAPLGCIVGEIFDTDLRVYAYCLQPATTYNASNTVAIRSALWQAFLHTAHLRQYWHQLPVGNLYVDSPAADRVMWHSRGFKSFDLVGARSAALKPDCSVPGLHTADARTWPMWAPFPHASVTGWPA